MAKAPHAAGIILMGVVFIFYADHMLKPKHTFLYRYLLIQAVNWVPTFIFYVPTLYITSLSTDQSIDILNIAGSFVSLVLLILFMKHCYEGSLSRLIFALMCVDFFGSMTSLIPLLLSAHLFNYESYHLHTWGGFVIFVPVVVLTAVGLFLILRKLLAKYYHLTKLPLIITHIVIPAYLMEKLFINVSPYYKTSTMFIISYVSSVIVLAVFIVFISYISKKSLLYEQSLLKKQLKSSELHLAGLKQQSVEIERLKAEMAEQLKKATDTSVISSRPETNEYMESLQSMLQQLDKMKLDYTDE